LNDWTFVLCLFQIDAMHRLSRRQLADMLNVLITCSRLKRRTGGRQISASLDTPEGASALTELICNAIDNDSKMVIATEMVGENHCQRPGKWAVDEPVPAIVPVPPAPPSASPKDR
jgi:hypothetical protein